MGTQFQGAKDIALMRRVQAEVFRRFMPTVSYFSLDIVGSKPDPLYGESLKRAYEAGIQYNAFVDPEPTEKLLTKFGFDEKQDVLIFILSQDVVNTNLNPKVGDVIVAADDIDNMTGKTEYHEYEVMEVSFKDVIFNTSLQSYCGLNCALRRPSSVTDDRVAKTQVNVPPRTGEPVLVADSVPALDTVEKDTKPAPVKVPTPSGSGTPYDPFYGG